MDLNTDRPSVNGAVPHEVEASPFVVILFEREVENLNGAVSSGQRPFATHK